MVPDKLFLAWGRHGELATPCRVLCLFPQRTNLRLPANFTDKGQNGKNEQDQQAEQGTLRGLELVIMIKLCIPVIFLFLLERLNIKLRSKASILRVSTLIVALGFQSQEMLDWVCFVHVLGCAC